MAKPSNALELLTVEKLRPAAAAGGVKVGV
jgi:hypothetical protein